MTVGRICSRSVDWASPDESVQVAAQRMHSRKVGTLVILNPARHPLGLVTDRDLTVRVLGEGRDAATTSVADVMTPAVKTVREDCPIELALEIMRKGTFRRLPVVNEQNQLVGLLSIDDILDLLSEEFRSIGRLLMGESPQSLGLS